MNLSRPLVWTLAVLGLVLGALIVRCRDSADVARRDGMLFSDNDTLRRLERMRAIAAAEAYPLREIKDGFPAGSVSHWTRPMDWTIAALDVVASPFFDNARPDEAGAAIAGPVLACLALLVLLFGLRALVGPGTALLAGLLYAFSYSTVNVSWFGNGDHHNLQHLWLCIFFFGSLLQLAGKAGAGVAALAGGALGLAVWVSTESMLLFYLWLATIGIGALLRPPAPGFWRGQLAWTAGLVAALLVGHLCEQSTFFAFEIDKVSWFQLYQALVWAVFVGLGAGLDARTRQKIVLAAATALVIGLLPLLVPSLRASIDAQRTQFAVVNVWLQGEVTEFRNLLQVNGFFSMQPMLQRFSYLVFALPAFLLGVCWTRALTPAVRLVLVLVGGGTFALACWEVKLAHLFAMTFPLLVVFGARGWLERLWRRPALPELWPGLVVGAAIVVAVATSQPALHSASAILVKNTETYREVANKLRARIRGTPDYSVLAPWDMSAHLMYYGDLPVVASGYHRNIDGIHDGYRLLLATPAEDAATRALLRERRVRYVVAWFSKAFLLNAPATIGRPPLVERFPQGISYTPQCRQTLFWRLRQGAVPGFREIDRGEPIRLMDDQVEPIYRLYEVVE